VGRKATAHAEAILRLVELGLKAKSNEPPAVLAKIQIEHHRICRSSGCESLKDDRT
jgi:hypothetical protein